MHRFTHILVVVAFALMMTGVLPWQAIADQEQPSSLEHTFQKAKQDYLDKNMNASAEQINKGAAYIKAQAVQASEKGKEALNASARELEQLADNVRKGIVTSQQILDNAFARAYLALASNDHMNATESWTQNQKAKAGEALDSANKNLEKSFAWAGQIIDKGATDALKKSEDLALKLKKKGSLILDDVGKGLQSAGNEIDNFKKKISSRPK